MGPVSDGRRVQYADTAGAFAEGVFVFQQRLHLRGVAVRREYTEHGGAGARHRRAQCAVVEKYTLYLRDRVHAPVVNVLKDVVYPPADLREILPAQGLGKPGGVGMAAQAYLIELFKQIRRGY